MKKLLYALVLIFALLGCAVAQIHTNLDDSPSGWIICLLPSCDPGGQPGATALVKTVTGTTRDGQALLLSMKGPAYSNALFYRNVGATTANYLALDLWAYVSSSMIGNTEALEYDAWAYNSPYRFMWGSQCVIGRDWYGWNDSTNHWVDLNLPCNLAVNKWHHIQWWIHRDNTTNCSGMPCTYQDMLGVDGVYTKVNLITPASPLPAGWGNNSGVNVQLDLNSFGGTTYEWVDEVNLTALGR